MTMLTRNAAELRATVKWHIEADAVKGGSYWNEVEQQGCFIGCLSHDQDGAPEKVFEKYRIPVMLQRIAEDIFEGLAHADKVAFFGAFGDVFEDNRDLSRVPWAFLASELRVLPPVPPDIQKVIDPVIEGMDLLAAGKRWPDADRAYAAAYAAAAAARAAADAAADAADAAAYAARAARQRQRDTLLRLIKEAPAVQAA